MGIPPGRPPPVNCWRTDTQAPAATSAAAPVLCELIRVLEVQETLLVEPCEFVAVRVEPLTCEITPLTPGFMPRPPEGAPLWPEAVPLGVPAAAAVPEDPLPHPATTTDNKTAPATPA